MYNCGKCGKRFSDNPYINYGFRKGKVFSLILCQGCRENTTESEINDQIEFQINRKSIQSKNENLD